LWGIQPSDFWAMTFLEWWWIYDAKHPQTGLDDQSLEKLYNMLGE